MKINTRLCPQLRSSNGFKKKIRLTKLGENFNTPYPQSLIELANVDSDFLKNLNVLNKPIEVKKSTILAPTEAGIPSVTNPGVALIRNGFFKGKVAVLTSIANGPENLRKISYSPEKISKLNFPKESTLGIMIVDPNTGKVVKTHKELPFKTLIGNYTDGIPDPRITYVKEDKTYHILYCGTNHEEKKKVETSTDPSKAKFFNKGEVIYQGGSVILSMTTKDFINFSEPKRIGSPYYDRNATLFPKKFFHEGKQCYAMLRRIFPDVELAFIPDIESLRNDEKRIKYWQTQDTEESIVKNRVLEPIFRWENVKDDNVGCISAGAPPLEITLPKSQKKAWLLIYNASSRVEDTDKYPGRLIGAAILDYDDPRKVIARLPEPLIKPTTYQEKYGMLNNVCFATGATIINNTLDVYYGAADTSVMKGRFKLNDLLNHMLQYDEKGNKKF
jgi:predicted GH43/DUF377 family glycosyl hydrolase